MTPEIRQQIIAWAYRWIGTPYHHMGDVWGPKGGVDCAMLPVRVFCDMDIVPQFDPRPYPHDWMLHRSEERYLQWVEQFADCSDVGEPADLCLFRHGRTLSHGGIVCEPGYMIHADLHAGKVERCEIARFQDRLAGYWRVR